MIPTLSNPEIEALYASRTPAPAKEAQPATDLAPQYARAPAGDGHEAALKQRSGQQ